LIKAKLHLAEQNNELGLLKAANRGLERQVAELERKLSYYSYLRIF
jgi:hypothetical protein